MDNYDPNEFNEIARQQAKMQYSPKSKGIKQEFNAATDELQNTIQRNFRIRSAKKIIEEIQELEYSRKEHAHYGLCRGCMEKINFWDNVFAYAILFFVVAIFVSGFINPFVFFLMPIAIIILIAGYFMFEKRTLTTAIIIFTGMSFIAVMTLTATISGGLHPYLAYLILVMVLTVWYLTAMFIKNTFILKAMAKTEGFPMFLEFMDKNTRIKRAVRSAPNRYLRYKQKELKESKDIEIDINDIEPK